MPISVTVHVDPVAEVGEIVSDLYSVMSAQPYTPEALIPILCAFEYTDWCCDGCDAYVIHRELGSEIKAVVEAAFDRLAKESQRNGCQPSCERTRTNGCDGGNL